MGLTPATPAELAEAIRQARASGVPLGPVSLVAMDRVVAYEPADLIVTCQAGVTLAALQQRLGEGGQFLPVWHPRAESVSVGELVATGWTGLGRQLYGRLRDRVLEVRAVTGEGKLVRGGARVVKNVTGFDLPRLLCGSGSSLAVLVEVSLKVHPLPPPLFCVRRDVAASAQPLERVARFEGDWRYSAFAPGPPADACALLGVDDPEPGDELFVSLATDDALLGPAAPAPQPLPAGGLVDVASGVAWCGLLAEPPAPGALELMRRLKALFDPDGVLEDGP